MVTLVLGGARSGKSRYAQAICKGADKVVYVATAPAVDTDDEMLGRIARHRAERPSHWRTIEESLDLARVVREMAPPDAMLLVDCVTLWLSNLAWEHRALTDDQRESFILERVVEFAEATREREVVAVSNEVGSGIVPANGVARSFRDVQGLANQTLARYAARVILLVVGLPLVLKGSGDSQKLNVG